MPNPHDSATTPTRTADAVAGALSPQEREALRAHQQEWERRHLRTEPMEADAAGRAIGALYRAARLPMPHIVLVSSPGALALAATLAAWVWQRRRTEPGYRPHAMAAVPPVQDCRGTDLRGSAVAAALAAIATDDSTLWPAADGPGSVAEQILAATHAPADVATANAMDAACHRAVQDVTTDLHDLRHALNDAMRDAFNNGTLTPLMQRTARDIGDDLARRLLPDPHDAEAAMKDLGEWFRPAHGGNVHAYWTYLVTAPRDVLGLRLPEHAAFAAWEQCAIDTGYRYLHPQFCLVADFPVGYEEKDEAQHTLGTGMRRYRWGDGWDV